MVNKKLNYDSNGLLHGEYQSFYSDGSFQERSNFSHGEYNGNVLFYNENGVLYINGNYKLGVRIGFHKIKSTWL